MAPGEETTEAGFLINGKEYPVPGIDSFDMDEDVILWDYTRLAREDFLPVDPETDDAEGREAERQQKLKHPGLMRTLLHVAYQRGNPTAKPAAVAKLIGKVKFVEAITPLLKDEPEDDAGPPDQSALTSEHSESSPNDSNENDASTRPSTGPSGNGSTNASSEQDETPVSTGATKSDTSFLASDETT
jgi:hypothetical protein